MGASREGTGSSVPYYVREPQVQRLPTLLTAIREGALRIPDFQRAFVWKDSQRLKLFDSIVQGFPIGTVLVWRTANPGQVGTIDRVGPLALPPPTPQWNQGGDLLIDGQQRLTTLYTALSPNPLPGGEDWDDMIGQATLIYGSEEAARKWGVYFDAIENEFCLAPRHGPVPSRYVPLYLLLRNIPLYRFLPTRDRTLSPQQIERVEELASRFKDYAVPVVPVVTDDIATAVQSFERVNTRATKLTQFDIAHALGRKEKVNLAETFRSIRERVEATGWGEIDDNSLGYATKLAVGLQAYSYGAVRFVEGLALAKDLPERIGTAFERAIGFLRTHCGVHGEKAIPYKFQLVLLTDLFRLDQEVPHPDIVAGATRWFWMTTFTEHFASQRKIKSTNDGLQMLARGETPDRIVDDLQLNPIKDLAFNHARVKGFLLWLAKTRDPRGADGSSLRIPHELGVRGSAALHPLVPRSQLPTELLRRAGNVLLCAPEDVDSLRDLLLTHTSACSPEMLASHAIGPAARDLLIQRDYVGFVVARHHELDLLERAFVQQLGLQYTEEPIAPGDDDPEA